MDTVLHVNLYDLKVRIHCPRLKDREKVAGLLSLFLTDAVDDTDLTIEFSMNWTPQEIGALLYPHLADRGIWAVHASGFHYHGGYLAVGPSDCGKSTFSYMAMRSGCFLASDDITLLRQSPDGIEILPFYASLHLADRIIFPGRERFKPAVLRYLLLPQSNCGSLTVKKVDKRVDILRRLVPQFLWSHNSQQQKRQRVLLENLCDYPAYDIGWDPGLLQDDKRFMDMLDEIVQGEGKLHVSRSAG